jgi:hypothetical protein
LKIAFSTLTFGGNGFFPTFDPSPQFYGIFNAQRSFIGMQKQFIQQISLQAIQMLEQDEPRNLILQQLVFGAEKLIAEDEVCSILVLDDEGLLRNGASPRLPADYLKAIDKLKPDAKVGTCSASAATGTIIITPDFRADDKWMELKHLPLALGYIGAWSVPIKNVYGRVLGTFGTYLKKSRFPTDEEIANFQLLCETAAKVMMAPTKTGKANSYF